jgi:DNA polymerase-3 subunit alpha
VVVTMPLVRCTPPMIERLTDVLATHRGTTEVQLRLTGGAEERVLRVADQYRVKPSAALMGDLKALLGPTAISA